MSDKSDAQIRRRWINLGEFVAVAGLLISGLALWNSWGGKDEQPVAAKAEPRAIPLVLRGRVQGEGEALVLAPVEAGHALDSLTLSANDRAIEVGSDGEVSARAVESLVGKPNKGETSGAITVRVAARYVEAGEDRAGGGTYRIRYRWDGGGLFDSRELRLVGWSRG